LVIDYKSFDEDLLKLEANYSYKSDEVYYYNVHRQKALILKLQQRFDFFDYATLPLIFSNIHEEIESYEVLKKKGTGHVIILVRTTSGRDLVLRVNLLIDEPEHYMNLEKIFIQKFASIGIGSSEVLFSDTSRKQVPFDYQIMERLIGKGLGEEWEGTQSDYDAISTQFGANAAKMYKLPGKGWGRLRQNATGELYGTKNSLVEYLTTYLEHDLEMIQLFKFISVQDAEKIHNYFYSPAISDLFGSSTQSYFIHNDPSDLNMRYEGNKLVAVFDWENAAMYDPICELGSASTWTVQYPKDEQMIAGFVQELGYTPDNLQEKMSVYFLRKMLDKVQFALRGERLAEKHIRLFAEGCKRNGLDVKVLVTL